MPHKKAIGFATLQRLGFSARPVKSKSPRHRGQTTRPDWMMPPRSTPSDRRQTSRPTDTGVAHDHVSRPTTASHDHVSRVPSDE